MATVTRTDIDVSALRSDKFPFGPWTFQRSSTYTLFLGADIQIAATTLAQIIGGVSPSIESIVTVQFLLIYPNQNVRIGLHGVNGQTAGFTLNLNSPLIIDNCSINALNIFNTASSAANVFVAIGGTAT